MNAGPLDRPLSDGPVGQSPDQSARPPVRRRPRLRLSLVNHEPASRFYRAVVLFVHVVFTPFGRRDYQGSEKMPATGGVLVVANHISRLDTVPLAEFVIWSGRWPHFLAKASLFRSKLVGWVMRMMDSVPVDRRSPRAADALIPAAAKLNAGQVVVVYPEGTETHDPDLWPMTARTGAARLALMTGCAPLPVAQWGAHKLLPPHAGVKRDLRRRRFQFVCGDPVDLSDLANLEMTREVLELATTRIVDALTELVAGLRQETPPADRYDRRHGQRMPVVRELAGPGSSAEEGPDARVDPSRDD